MQSLRNGARVGVDSIANSHTLHRFCFFSGDQAGNTHINTTRTTLVVDQALITRLYSTNSFTGEDDAEMLIHGSLVLIQKLTETCRRPQSCRSPCPPNVLFLNCVLTVLAACLLGAHGCSIRLRLAAEVGCCPTRGPVHWYLGQWRVQVHRRAICQTRRVHKNDRSGNRAQHI